MHSMSSQATPDALPLAVHAASLVLAVLLSSLLVCLASKNRGKIPCMSGMMTAMTNATMSGLTTGTVLGIMQMTMFVPTAVATLFGLAVGYLTGRPYGLIAVIDGMLAGIMGGLMGAMLGVMVMNDHPTDTVLLIDLLFVILTACSVKHGESFSAILKTIQKRSCSGTRGGSPWRNRLNAWNATSKDRAVVVISARSKTRINTRKSEEDFI
ncbi:hypothetical protein H1164_01145 [Thermoactinomyces daqus]|uniref:Uncharacterized protein n=1 Tax=Thermoactinomyces daqus TaxID=1329516 RepID=A0A7W2AHA7_9BACL|nr:hypothetical protein [Thermoactinomyces daqus]MBA4541514.1 hypothetical protein [Thermoactinomyces daqus]